MRRPLLDVEDLHVDFRVRGDTWTTGSNVLRAVDGVSLSVERGTVVSVVGESGSGKTTFARAIVRLVHITRGQIHFDGTPVHNVSGGALRALRRRIQIVFQNPYSSLNPKMTVEQLVSEPLVVHNIVSRDQRDDEVTRVLNIVGLTSALRSRYPRELSGGQRQRVMLARVLAIRPEFVVLDEPISSLDVSIQAQILNLLMDLRDEFQLTYIFVSHDLAVVAELSDEVAVMYLGKIVERGPVRVMFKHPRHPYTAALLSAVPVPDPIAERSRRRILLPGELPSPIDIPKGCRFRKRCWLYRHLDEPELCETTEPELPLDGGHPAACHFSDRMSSVAAAQPAQVGRQSS